MSIGYGTKALSKDDFVTKDIARKRLQEYLESVTYKKIEKYNLTDSQKIAFSSFDYNTGRGHKLLQNGKINCKKILLYNKVKGKVNSQIDQRRHEEYNLCIKDI